MCPPVCPKNGVLEKNIQIADDYKRSLIDNQKEVESHQKNIKILKEEKQHNIEQYNQLARWAQDAKTQLVNR